MRTKTKVFWGHSQFHNLLVINFPGHPANGLFHNRSEIF